MFKIDLFERQSLRGRDRASIHYLTPQMTTAASTGPDEARTFWFLTWRGGSSTMTSPASPATPARSTIESGVARIRTTAHVWCWHCRWLLSLLCNNAGANLSCLTSVYKCQLFTNYYKQTLRDCGGTVWELCSL